jgi:hypothetical protein
MLRDEAVPRAATFVEGQQSVQRHRVYNAATQVTLGVLHSRYLHL